MKKQILSLNILLGLMTLSLTSPSCALAQSGGGSTGGADSVSCNDWLGKGSVQLADLTGVKNKSPWDSRIPGSDQALRLIMDYLSQYRADESVQVKDALQALSFHVVQTADLDQLDTGLRISKADAFFKGCKKIQLATQDVDSGVVSYSGDLFNELSPLEQGFFKVHEAYVRIAMKQGTDLQDAESYARERTGTIYADSEHFNNPLVAIRACITIPNSNEQICSTKNQIDTNSFSYQVSISDFGQTILVDSNQSYPMVDPTQLQQGMASAVTSGFSPSEMAHFIGPTEDTLKDVANGTLSADSLKFQANSIARGLAHHAPVASAGH